MDVFFRRYGERLRADVARHVPAGVDVEAVTREAVLRALADPGRFATERALYRYCRATAIDLARPRAGFHRWESPHPDLAGLPHGTVCGPERIVEHRQALRDVLDALGAQDRAALLAWMRGESPAEIGQRLGVTAPAAKQAVHRARKKARDTWAGALYGGACGSALWRTRQWAQVRAMPPALTNAQFAVANFLVVTVSVALVIGGSGSRIEQRPAEAPKPPAAYAAFLGPRSPGATDDRLAGGSAEFGRAAHRSGPASGGALPPAASVPDGEACSPPYPPVGSTCAGTGPPSQPGTTLYLKRLGKDGPHVTQPVVGMCDTVPENSEVGCDSEEPPDGYQNELPPWPGRKPDDAKESA